jgi:phosphoesterase RecJ-like protein
MMMNDPIESICRKIAVSKRIVITSHLRPDGDSLCTSLALYFMGRQLEKDMAIINKDNTPFPFQYFPDIDIIQRGQIAPRKYDAVILLECANVGRSGQLHIGDYFKINMDHHRSNDRYADINWVDPDASAVAELAFKLGKKLKIRFSPQIADNLYCAIVSDTGSFQFSNTNAESFKSCYELVKLGASPIRISELLFRNNSPEKIKLLGLVLSTLYLSETGDIAVITMFKKHLDSLHLKEIDTEDITTLTRSIKGVEVVLFFKEMTKGTFRVSIRSKGPANAAGIAEYFGGGGHRHAAGFTVSGKYDQLIHNVPLKVQELLKSKRMNKKYPEPHISE